MNVDNALKELKAAIISEVYSEIYYAVQSLGGPGLHSENMINRQEVLDALKRTKKKMIDKL